MAPPEHQRSDEEQPLIAAHHGERSGYENGEQDSEPQKVTFSEEDDDNPKKWGRKKKLMNVFIIALMAILSPLASSMYSPGIAQIAEEFDVTMDAVIATTTGYVILMGIGPLILAPLSETFGRRKIYISCFAVFTLLQIPTALAPNIATLIALRTVAGFFGSVGVANGGGTISDMYESNERASIFGWYLLGPLLGPTIGSFFLTVYANLADARRPFIRWHHRHSLELEMDLRCAGNRVCFQHNHRLPLPS